MRQIPGWVAGAFGTAAIVASFYAGGTLKASNAETATLADTSGALVAPEAPDASPLAPAIEVECEPGQRALVRASRDGATPNVVCVSDPRPLAGASRTAHAPAVISAPDVVRVANTSDRPYARPAVIAEPVEVYRPRSRPVAYETRDARPERSVKKSVAIIGGSTAAGAVLGGLVKGGKGAVVGGLLGGGAATVWDQVTRRRDSDIR